MGAASSYRFRLQASFVGLGLLAIGVADWQASMGAAAALRQATYDRLTAIRETKRRAVENYFRDTVNHVLALSADESSVAALEEFRSAWNSLPQVNPPGDAYRSLRAQYERVFAATVAGEIGTSELMAEWFPADGRVRALQHAFLAANPNPLGAKDLLLEPAGVGSYGAMHARYHPTLHRYQTAFGFYDIFLIDARDGRVLYTVFKEIDLGASLTEAPHRETALAEVYRRAMKLNAPEQAVIEDYVPYMPSHLTPAAFIAAPIWRAGQKIGVLAIQVSLQEVNQVMTGDRNWKGEGLGDTGQAYLAGMDRKLRSDIRFEIENAEGFLAGLRRAGVADATIRKIERNRTAVLNLTLDEKAGGAAFSGRPGTELGTDFRGVEVLRSHAPLSIPGLDWVVVAEMEAEEAFSPIQAVRKRTLATGLMVAALFFLAAWWLARSVTRPVLALAEGAGRLGRRDFGVRLPAQSQDELGHLAAAFNRMAAELERTTVSRDELEVLNSRLIQAQEEERRRLARELHDDITQRLAALAIETGRMKNEEAVAGRQALERMHRQITQISDDIHGLSRRLHPATLDDLGLVAAVEGECRAFFERGGPPVEFDVRGTFEDLDPDARLSLYRIVQEGLRNIHRHADAGEVAIQLRREGEGISLEIRDNGRGFDRGNAEWKAGLGLASMEERVRLVGGRLRVESAPGRGTVITVDLPKVARDEETSSSVG